MERVHSSHSSTGMGEASERFPVVGVGASAGGLAATSELLRHLGESPGVAVVFVQHLDPTHESSLVEILSRTTPLPVEPARDGSTVERNHVYVLPPSADLHIAGGVLRLTPRGDSGGPHLHVDRFFESLAGDHTTLAVGVLLSGTGSDGAAGMKAIKGASGVTFAQDASAEYRGMPDSAVALGCVDFVMAPEAIAREIIRIGQNAAPVATTAEDGPDFQRIILALRKATRVDFGSYKRSTIRRRVRRRVLVHGLPDLRAYADLVESSPAEATALCEEVLIHVTSFFRDPETFEALEKAVFPRLLEKRPRDACLRMWVPGCSTGEEVYSLTMSLLDFLAAADAGDVPVKVFGSDVSPPAIEKARRGRYPPSIAHEVSPERLKRYFVTIDGGYQIRKFVRDVCVFARHDATRDPPFSGLDLVSCRNLLIYLGPALQDRLLPVLHYALKEPGFLVLGISETTRAFPGFALLDPRHKIYTRTSAAPRLHFDFATPDPLHTSPSAARPSGPREVHREADRLVLAEFGPPGFVVTDDLAIVQFRGKTGPYLDPSPGAASFELLRMVKDELRLAVRQTIDEARDKQSRARRQGLRVGTGEASRAVDLEVIPFGIAASAQRFFVVLFEEHPLAAAPPDEATTPAVPAEEPSAESRLERELDSTRCYLQSVIEQVESSNEELEGANEEIVSSNEELRSTNEELQMAKEELQATNEELRTVNDEMAVRNAAGTRLNDDLVNVLSSAEVPIVILGRDARLRRFTPAAAKVFRLGASDLGRPIGDLDAHGLGAGLARAVSDVLERLTTVTRTAQDEEGHFYQLAVRPYLTTDNRIDGTVVTAFDIDALERGKELVTEAREYAENIVDTVHEGLLVLERDLRVRSANRAFYRTFGLTPAEVEGRFLHHLGRGDWDVPDLRTRLKNLVEGEKLEAYRLQRVFEGPGARVFMLDARHVERRPWILLALEDVTEKERAEGAARQTELRFRDMLTTAAEAIVMSDADRRIVFANDRATEIFGYAPDEVLGLSVDALVPERFRTRHARHCAEFMARPDAKLMASDEGLRGRRKDGTEFPLEIRLSSMKSGGGALAVSFITDVTERREADRKLHEYQARLQKVAFDATLAEERERRRIAVDLHDHIGQTLALAQMKLKSSREVARGSLRTTIDEAVELIAQSVADTRTLTFELSPPVLYDLGLAEALSWLAEDLEKRRGLRVKLSDDHQPKTLDDARAGVVFRAVRELLINASKHAKAEGATVALRRRDDWFEIDVEDDGDGFDPDAVAVDSRDGGFGLFSVREQMSRLGGTLDVTSAPGKGTRVSMRVPLGAAGPAVPAASEPGREA